MLENIESQLKKTGNKLEDLRSELYFFATYQRDYIKKPQELTQKRKRYDALIAKLRLELVNNF